MNTTEHMPVAALIRARKQADSKPKQRTDNAKIGLVIEGGGMRGVVSAGMVAGLESLGMRECFDAVYGSSAGTITGAYFVAGQARFGTTIFYQDINNREFVDLRRMWSSKPVLSLEFLLDHVAESVKPLHWDAVINSDVPLTAVASSLTESRAVYLRDFENKQDLRECMRASARIPIVAGQPVTHRNHRLWDALVYEAIPVGAAIADGCTHIVALLTRPSGHARSDLTFFETHIIAHLIGNESISARRAYLKRARRYNDLVSSISSGTIGIDSNQNVASLAVQIPGSCVPVKGTEISHELLLEGARAGFEAVYRAFNLSVPQVVEVLTAF